MMSPPSSELQEFGSEIGFEEVKNFKNVVGLTFDPWFPPKRPH